MAKTSKKAKGAPVGTKLIASNKQARRNYDIDDVLEAGVVLMGSEVKAMRESQVQLADAYARIRERRDLARGRARRAVRVRDQLGRARSRPAHASC